MKTSFYARIAVLASIVLAPLAAVAHDSDVTQACFSAFIAQNFPGQKPIVKMDQEGTARLPFLLSQGTIHMKLSATSRDTGRVLVTALCTNKRGVVTLTPDNSAALIASR